MTAYRLGMLDPTDSPKATETNSPLLGGTTLGIEFTVPDLAAQCGLGNIDPQHGDGDGTMAAIEAAIIHPLPVRGATLVTIRPDADAFGAMAVLAMRAAGQAITPAMRARIGAIAAEDSFLRGPWPGPRPLPTTAEAIDEVGPGVLTHGALVGGLIQARPDIDYGVRIVGDWIRHGTLPMGWLAWAQSAAAAIVAAIAQGSVKAALIRPGIALVEGGAAGALRLGYRLAPVVIAVDTRPRGMSPMAWRRVSIAQWSAGHVDLRRATALLSAEEPGWGGSATIIGSPQGIPTALPLQGIIRIIKETSNAR